MVVQPRPAARKSPFASSRASEDGLGAYSNQSSSAGSEGGASPLGELERQLSRDLHQASQENASPFVSAGEVANAGEELYQPPSKALDDLLEGRIPAAPEHS